MDGDELRTLRLLGGPQRVIRSRPIAIAGSLIARLGLIDAVAAWPQASAPTVALSLGDATAKSWMQPLLPARARALASHPGAWQAARARALVLPRGRSVLVAAAEAALGRELAAPRVSLYSPNACAGKITCFIGEAGRREPTVVVKAMARRGDGWWLRGEVEKLTSVRALLCGAAAVALPPAPLFAGEIEGEYVLVERYERFAGASDRSDGAATRAHRWLADFRLASARAPARWCERDTARALSSVFDAWMLLRPRAAASTVRSTRALLEPLHGAWLSRCATHGDFAPDNLATAGGRLRVFDWEWSALEGAPQFDLWTYQLAQLHWRTQGLAAEHLDEALRDAVAFVEDELESARADRRLAAATLAVVLAELVVRVRRTLGGLGPWERCGARLMAAVERAQGSAGLEPPAG